MFAAAACSTNLLVVKQQGATVHRARRVIRAATTVSSRAAVVSAAAAAAAAMGEADENVPAIIVGGGRIGQALADMGVAGDVIMKRGDAFPASPATGPVYVCTRNDALQEVVDQTPESRRGDLVFLQNGMLQPWLDARGLGDNTQALIYFAVAKAGEKPTDGITDKNPEVRTFYVSIYVDNRKVSLSDGFVGTIFFNPSKFREATVVRFNPLERVCSTAGECLAESSFFSR